MVVRIKCWARLLEPISVAKISFLQNASGH
jgi:hypothetical protein